MSNQVGDCFKFVWPFQNVRTLITKIQTRLVKLALMGRKIRIGSFGTGCWIQSPTLPINILLWFRIILKVTNRIISPAVKSRKSGSANRNQHVISTYLRTKSSYLPDVLNWTLESTMQSCKAALITTKGYTSYPGIHSFIDVSGQNATVQ